MVLTSNPPVVAKQGKNESNCTTYPYYHQLTIWELNGVEVNLTRLRVAGFDYTNQIQSWFGSTTLPASGKLTAGICWQPNSVPTTFRFDVTGVDSFGKQVRSTLDVRFVDEP
jgi:hypothetical protein